MLSSRRWLLAAAAIGGVAATMAACSVIVESRSQQCTGDADCARFPHAACDMSSHICIDKQDLYCEEHDCSCARDASVSITNNCTNAERHCYDDSKLPPSRPLPTSNPGAGGAQSIATNCPSSSGGGGAGGTTGTGGTTGAGGASAGGGGGGTTLPICDHQQSPVYTIGPDSIKPLLSWVATYYAKNNLGTVVYQDESSCVAVDKAYGGTQSQAGKNGRYMEYGVGFTSYFDAQGVEHDCVIKGETIPPDIFLSDVFAETCGYKVNGAGASHVSDTFGPVQAFGFVVPNASTEESISYGAALNVYGFGDASMVPPWDEQKYIYTRNPTSGTEVLIASLLGIEPTKMRATQTTSSFDEAGLVACSPKPEKTIGILAADLVQQPDTKIKLLAYQHDQQTCGYLPDSSRDSNDKVNVRDGHYYIWGPVHMLQVGNNPNPAATNLINFVSGTVPPPSNDIDDLFHHWVEAHLVPQCAMRVRRDQETGPLIDFHPKNPCSCRYDLAATGKTACKPCGPDCKTCNDGYCEPE